MVTSRLPEAVPGRLAVPPLRAVRRGSVSRRLAATSIGCALIATFLWSLVPSLGRSGFLPVLVHAQLIGLGVAGLCMVVQRRILPRSPSRLAFASAHATCSMAGLAIGLVLARLVLGLPLHDGPWFDGTDALVATGVTTLVASCGFIAHFRSRARLAGLARHAAEEARRADSARLSLLRAQLDPHMLFNTLANLRALIATDAPRAQRMVDHLVPFLRATLDGSREDAWTLAREFDEVRHYLEIMAIRLGGRLEFTLDLPASARHVLVPSLLLQPLVENAVRHGVEPSLSGGRVIVSVEESAGGSVLVTVGDSGRSNGRHARLQGRLTGPERASGARFGLDLVRERLQLLYGDAASMTLVDGSRDARADGACDGTRVRIRLPVGRATSTDPVS